MRLTVDLSYDPTDTTPGDLAGILAGVGETLKRLDTGSTVTFTQRLAHKVGVAASVSIRPTVSDEVRGTQ